MSDVTAGQNDLINHLALGLRPVRRLASPWRRAALWLAASLWLAGIIGLFVDWTALTSRLMHTPDMGLAFAGGLATAVLAALAAFLTSVPGRSAWWALMPLPPLALWLGASSAGCLRRSAAPFTRAEPPMHSMQCIYFIVLIAAPLATLLMLQLRRACPLRPGLTATLGGLASAGAAATLLALVHPFDATLEDLGAHLLAVILVVGGTELLGRQKLAARLSTARRGDGEAQSDSLA
jgi:hypothetical protein